MRDKSEFIEKQIQTFNAIKNYIKDNKIPPTIRELGEILEIKSTATMWKHIKRLETDGYISMTDLSNRSIRIEKDFVVKREENEVEIVEEEKKGEYTHELPFTNMNSDSKINDAECERILVDKGNFFKIIKSNELLLAENHYLKCQLKNINLKIFMNRAIIK